LINIVGVWKAGLRERGKAEASADFGDCKCNDIKELSIMQSVATAMDNSGIIVENSDILY
jgi:hypothetical protein